MHYAHSPDVVVTLDVHIVKPRLLVLVGFLASVRHFQHDAPFHLRHKRIISL